MEQLALRFMQEWIDSFHRKNYNAKERKQMNKIIVVVIVKRTAGCAENQGCWPSAWKYGMYNNWSKTLFFRFTTGWTRGALYTAL